MEDELKKLKNTTFIKGVNIGKSFKVGNQMVDVLKDITLEIDHGDFVIIFGPSGSGKSTLLHCLLGLEAPSKGQILVDNKDFYGMTEDERSQYRRHRVGMIYQQSLWINSLNVIDNVVFALHLLDYNRAMIEQKGLSVLETVGMQDWAQYRPTELSSGQQQKISLARAIVIDPILIVADEPTGNLDTVSGQELVDTFMKINAKGITIIMITHDLEYLKYATKLVHMLDGKVVEVYKPKKRAVMRDAKGKKAIATDKQTDLRDPAYLKKLGL